MSIREYEKEVKSNKEYERLSSRIKKELKEDIRFALILPKYNSSITDVAKITVSVWTNNTIADEKIKKVLHL